jgi:hypothetical protein
MGFGAHWSVGAKSIAGPSRNQPGGDVAALGKSVFTTYLFAFEITSALLVIAVVGAVVLARRPGGVLGEADSDPDEPSDDADPAPAIENATDTATATDTETDTDTDADTGAGVETEEVSP